jgi:cell division FtsZ-interacting protein ZapD
LKFKGTISKMEWTNPHVWLHLDVKNKNGQVETWAFEAGTPNVLFRRGLTKESVKIGMEVTVDGYQAKDGSHRANGRDLVLADGRTMFLGSTGTGAPYELSPTTSKP